MFRLTLELFCLVRSQNAVDNVTSDYSEKQVSVDIDFWNRERLMSYLSNIAFTDIAALARGKKNKRIFLELFYFIALHFFIHKERKSEWFDS